MSDTTPPADLVPDDDFGASVLAQFAKREFGTGGAAMMNDGGVPGSEPQNAQELVDEWVGGATIDASKVESAKHFDAAALLAATGTDTDAANDEGQLAGDADAGEGGTESTTDSSGGSGDTTGNVDTPELGTTTSPADPPASTEGEQSGGYTWTEGDQSIPFTDEQVQQALLVHAWATNLPEQTRTVFGAIESGTAVAIPRAEYDQYQAWQHAQRTKNRDADLEQLDLEPDVAQAFKEMRDEIAALKGEVPGQQVLPSSPQLEPINPNYAANHQATATAMDQAAVAFATENSLSQQELGTLYDATIAANIIPTIAQQMATYNPVNGQLIRPADPAAVMRQALDHTLIRNPELHTSVIQRKSVPATGTPATQPSTITDPVVAKKARAASVASAPSAAVTPSPKAPSSMSPMDVVRAIEKEIVAASSNGN